MECELNKLSLTVDEEAGIALDFVDVIRSTDECRRSLFGKIHGAKKANFSGLKKTMSQIWSIREPFQLLEIGPNLFQFVFKSQTDKTKVLQSRAWTFDNQFLILKEWVQGMDINKQSFNQVELWVQVWDLPLDWVSIETGLRFGKIFDSISDVRIPESGSVTGRHIKLLVCVNLDKPLIRGTYVRLGHKSCWVRFKYEKMVGFCFYCGLVGHTEKMCVRKEIDLGTNSLREGQYGQWLKAEEMTTVSQKNNNKPDLFKNVQPFCCPGSSVGRKFEETGPHIVEQKKEDKNRYREEDETVSLASSLKLLEDEAVMQYFFSNSAED